MPDSTGIWGLAKAFFRHGGCLTALAGAIDGGKFGLDAASPDTGVAVPIDPRATSI